MRWRRKYWRRGPASFLVQNPGLTLQFLTSSENVKFSRWQADLAMRLRKPDKGDFTISKLGEFALYLIEPAAEADAAPVICAYPDELGPIPESQFLKARGCMNARVSSPTISA